MDTTVKQNIFLKVSVYHYNNYYFLKNCEIRPVSEKKCCKTLAGVKLFVYLKCIALQGAERGNPLQIRHWYCVALSIHSGG